MEESFLKISKRNIVNFQKQKARGEIQGKYLCHYFVVFKMREHSVGVGVRKTVLHGASRPNPVYCH